ncbi:MAG: ATP-dependent Clp protease adapter ClpS [Acidobacteria bacterium]|nr:ATP-dependent Clp protease adapter ClpS [Acidobacteriota bacterium]
MGEGEKTKRQTEVLEKPRSAVKTPSLYKVILHNDDYTTMEFVVQILETVFQKTPAEAHRLMMQVHTEGYGVCGAYTYEVAETKVTQTHELARASGYPLLASIEEE